MSLITHCSILNSLTQFYIGIFFQVQLRNLQRIYAKVNSLTSIETELPYSYYNLPYCKPHDGVKKSAENLGELFTGDQIDNSPYRFRMNVNETIFLYITSPLSEQEVKLLKQRTSNLNQVNMMLDNGFPIGYSPPNNNDDYVISHLKFRVLIHEYEGNTVEIFGLGEEGMGVISETDKKRSGYGIVCFEVVPCSVKQDPEVMSKLHMYDNISSINCLMELGKSQIIKEKE